MSAITLQEAQRNFSLVLDKARRDGAALVSDGDGAEFWIFYRKEKSTDEATSPFYGIRSVKTLKEKDVEDAINAAKDDRYERKTL